MSNVAHSNADISLLTTTCSAGGGAIGAAPKARADQPKRGGWFQKCLELVKAVRARAWVHAQTLADDYASLPSMRSLLDADHRVRD